MAFALAGYGRWAFPRRQEGPMVNEGDTLVVLS